MPDAQEPLNYRGQFPSPLLPKEIMNRKETGYAVAKAIYETSIYGANSYYTIRNARFAQNRTFAIGRQPFSTYEDLLGVDGKISFANYDFHPRPIAPKFRDILVNDIMERMEQVECTGLSLAMQNRKDDRKNQMAFKMKHGDFINAAEQAAGMKFSDDGQDFVPQDEEELELWAELNNKEKEEALMSYGVDFMLYNNDWKGIKKEVAEDLVDTGLACAWTFLDGRKRIRVKRVRPEYLVYGATNTLNFRNIPYVCHLERISILDVRAMYPAYSEKKLYQLAYQFRGLYGNPQQLTDFIIDYELAYTRPYDSYLIDVLFFRYKVLKTIDYVKGTDGNDNPIFEFRKGSTESKRKKPHKIQIPTWYEGAWLVGDTEVMSWGEMQNLIRNNEDVEDVQSGYAIYMLNNNGDMLPMSPMESIRSSIVQMDLSILRMQNVIATTPPNGVKMDIDAIMEVDMGKGIGKIGPMKMREIYTQTGDVYYSGSKISGDAANKNPVEQLLSSFGDKLQQYIAVYNFELNCIRDYLGINEVKDGSGVPARIGLGVMQNQINASNMSTAHIYNGFVSIMTDTCKAVAILLWDVLNTPETNDMYVKLLGRENVDFIRYNKDITRSNYLTKISVNMNATDLAWIDNLCTVAVQQKQMMPEDALMVKKYAQFNFEYAVRYLSYIQKKRERATQDAAMQQAQQQQQATAQLTQAQIQAKQADEANKDKRTLMINQNKAQSDYMLKLQELINASIIEFQTNGTPIPSYVQNLMDNQHALQLQQQQEQIDMMENELQISDMQMMAQGARDDAQEEEQEPTQQVA